VTMNEFDRAAEFLAGLQKTFHITDVETNFDFMGAVTTIRGVMFFDGGRGKFEMTFQGHGIPIDGNALPDPGGQQ
jgi:hypothetical protein